MIRAKKSLGQHFLKSETALAAIIDASDPTPDDIIVEVGPGEGVLTKELVAFAGKVIAIEKDSRLIPILAEKFASEIASGKFEIIEKDILDFDLEILKFYKHPYKVVANIPYYITGQILRMFLESEHQPELMTLLVQKEVAERIIARDGKESLLSLSVKAFGTPKLVRTVGRGAFSPTPTVDSAILLIENISGKNLGGIDPKFFFTILHAGFAHKRKQLLPNLAAVFPKEKITEALEKCQISPKSRAEDLSLEKWISLCKSYRIQ